MRRNSEIKIKVTYMPTRAARRRKARSRVNHRQVRMVDVLRRGIGAGAFVLREVSVPARSARSFWKLFPRKRALSGIVASSLIAVIAASPILFAFEGHVINVTAEIAMIAPPVITPPGGEFSSPIELSIDDSDIDASHIYYTVTPGTNPALAPDPVCGISAGGSKPVGPIPLSDDSVVKAIACDGDTSAAHTSIIKTEIYDFIQLKGKVEGRKYHDLDKNGSLSVGDFGIEGWNIELRDASSTLLATAVTDNTGYYSFSLLDPGTYTVLEETRDGWEATSASTTSAVIITNETITANFFNYDTGFACVPIPISFPAGLAVQAGGETSGNDDITVASNVTINGNVRSNDELEKIGGGSNRTVNGDVTVVNTVESGFTVSGSIATGTPPLPLPDAMIATWQAMAQAGGTVNGTFTFPTGTVGITLGPTEIMGDLVFDSSNAATIKGPVYVRGNLSIGSNSTITQDPAFGDQFAAIVVDGTIDIGSNVAFVGSGTSGAFLLISTHAAVAGIDAAIETSSNNSDLGDVVLYASNGDIHINSNRTILAAFAAHGTGADSDDNGAIRLDSNVTVNYRALPTTISCGPRQPFETTTHVLINEFMPNPSGSDQGTAGGALDGEWVELFNPTNVPVSVAGWVLYDNVDTHALPITAANTNTGGTTVPAYGYLVVYRDGNTVFELNNATPDSVRLFSGAIGSGGVLVDSHSYTAEAPDNKSFARIPDGSANWIDPDATPGDSNEYFLVPLNGVAAPRFFTPSPKPPLDLNLEFPRLEFESREEKKEASNQESEGEITEENSLTASTTSEQPTDDAPAANEESGAPASGDNPGGEQSETNATIEEAPQAVVPEVATVPEPAAAEESPSDSPPAPEPAPAPETAPEVTASEQQL